MSRASLERTFAIVTRSRADGLRADALIALNAAADVAAAPIAAGEAAGVAPPLMPARPIALGKRLLLFPLVMLPFSLLFIIKAATMPEGAVGATKVPTLYALGSMLMAGATLVPALIYYRNRRAIQRYDAEMRQPHPHREAAAIQMGEERPQQGLEDVAQSGHLPKSLTDPQMIIQLFSDNLTSLLAPSAEAIIDGITEEATTEQFIAAVNHIFADNPIDETIGNFSDARNRVGDLFRNRLNYHPTDNRLESRAENETRDDVVIQFLTLIFTSRHLRNNAGLRPGINREILSESCRDFYERTLVPHCKKHYGEEANILDGAWPLFSEVATGSEIDVRRFTDLNAARGAALGGGVAERDKAAVDESRGEGGGGGGGGGGGDRPSSNVVVEISAAAQRPQPQKEV